MKRQENWLSLNYIEMIWEEAIACWSLIPLIEITPPDNKL